MFKDLEFLWDMGNEKEHYRGQSRIDYEEGEWLYNLIQALPTLPTLVEIGRKFGGTTLLLALSRPDIKVSSVDNAPYDDFRVVSQMKRFHLFNTDLIVGDSKTCINDHLDIDLLFIDGDHSKEGCLADYYHWSPRVKNGGHIIFHDAVGDRADMGCVEAVNELVTLGILKNEHKSVSSMRHFIHGNQDR